MLVVEEQRRRQVVRRGARHEPPDEAAQQREDGSHDRDDGDPRALARLRLQQLLGRHGAHMLVCVAHAPGRTAYPRRSGDPRRDDGLGRHGRPGDAGAGDRRADARAQRRLGRARARRRAGRDRDRPRPRRSACSPTAASGERPRHSTTRRRRSSPGAPEHGRHGGGRADGAPRRSAACRSSTAGT